MIAGGRRPQVDVGAADGRRAAQRDEQAHGRLAAAGASAGSTPRSKRRLASLGSRCRRALRAIVTGAKCAASTTRSVVRAVTSVRGAAHHAGDADRAGVVGDHQVVGVERAVLPVQRGEPLPRQRAPDDEGALQRSRS